MDARRAKMERLTARNEKFPNEAHYPYCFQNDTCDGQGPSDKCDKCPLPYHICETLADYEDTDLTPEQIMELKERDTVKAAEPAPVGYGMICPVCGNLIQIWQKHCGECGQRLREDE